MTHTVWRVQGSLLGDPIEVDSLESLVALPWVAFWRRSPLFVRFSIASGVMVVEVGERAWYPVARFAEDDDGSWTGLAEWRGLALGLDPLARSPVPR